MASNPKSSKLMSSEAIGQFVTPQNTEAMPTAAQSPGSKPVREAKKLPNVAPIKSDGTISPPLYSPDNVMTVKIILSKKRTKTGNYYVISMNTHIYLMK